MSDDLIDRLKARCVYGDARLLLWKKHDPLSAEAAVEIYRLRVEIERLTKAHDTVCGALAESIKRAEKAETERDEARRQVAGAFEAAARRTGCEDVEYPSGVIDMQGEELREILRALTPADAKAALEARDREKVREGMQRAAVIAMQPDEGNAGMMFAEAHEFRDAILASMEKEGDQ